MSFYVKKDIVSKVCIPNQFLMTGTIFHHHMVPRYIRRFPIRNQFPKEQATKKLAAAAVNIYNEKKGHQTGFLLTRIAWVQ